MIHVRNINFIRESPENTLERSDAEETFCGLYAGELSDVVSLKESVLVPDSCPECWAEINEMRREFESFLNQMARAVKLL